MAKLKQVTYTPTASPDSLGPLDFPKDEGYAVKLVDVDGAICLLWKRHADIHAIILTGKDFTPGDYYDITALKAHYRDGTLHEIEGTLNFRRL